MLGKKEVILYDKDGNERFHWGPRVDRGAGGGQISDDGSKFLFYTHYTAEYADRQRVKRWSGDRTHLYDGVSKKELWSKAILDKYPFLFPDGSRMVAYSDRFGFDLYDSAGNKIKDYRDNTWNISVITLAPDGSHFAVTNFEQPLTLFDKTGAKLWDGKFYNDVASISDGAAYVTTYRYTLIPGETPDPQSYHLGVVYDKEGNVVMRGMGIVSGDGTRLALCSADKVVVYGLPDKNVIKEIPVEVYLPKVSRFFFAAFSHDGRYLVVRTEGFLNIYDLAENKSAEIPASDLGDFGKAVITKDGKYLLVNPDDSTEVYYYRLY